MKKLIVKIQSWFTNRKANKLHELLKNNVVTFVYTKKDGSKRVATGTLKNDVLVNVEIKHTNRKANPSVQTYFDIEKNAFRSFTKSSLVKIVEVA